MADTARKAVRLKDYLPEIDTLLTDVIAPLAEKTIGKNYLDAYMDSIQRYLHKEDEGKDDIKRHIARYIQNVGVKYKAKGPVDLKDYHDETDYLIKEAIGPLAEKIIGENVSWFLRSLVMGEMKRYLAKMQKYLHEDDDGSDEIKKRLALFLQRIGDKYNAKRPVHTTKS